MTSKSESTKPRASLAVVAQGYVTSKGDAAQATELLLRVHSLLGLHAERAAGVLCPSGVDIALAHLPDVAAAIEVGFAVQAEVEATRSSEGHRHGKLLAVGISFGDLVFLPDGRVLGTPMARALRLAVLAGPTGDVLLDERALHDELPAGLGRFEGKRADRDRVGFGFHHLQDYR